MDQNQTTTTTPSTDQNQPGMISAEQKQTFLDELGLDSLPEDQKTDLLDTMTETVITRILTRISPVLTDQDAQMIDTLQQNENADALVGQYLQSKVPNLGHIVNEEITAFRTEMKDDLVKIQTGLSQ